MKASELIKELEKQINSVGDREVVWYNEMESIFHFPSNINYYSDDYIVICDGDYSYD